MDMYDLLKIEDKSTNRTVKKQLWYLVSFRKFRNFKGNSGILKEIQEF